MDGISISNQQYYLYTQLFKASMQGEDAPSSIISALDAIHASDHPFDCVVIIRGGGSRADLECFNNYELAYYITQFPLPIVTGIGHERDESVADLVASYGLKTPTAVAEFLLEKFLAFEFKLSSFRDRLSGLVGQTVKLQQMRLERFAGDLGHLSRAFLQRHQERLDRSEQSIRKGSEFRLAHERERLYHLEAKKELVNPINVLKRGYSMTLYKGKVLSGTGSIKAGEKLETRLLDGTILSKVEKILNNNDKRKD